MNPKPIFIIKFPQTLISQNRDQIYESFKDISKLLYDYHVLAIVCDSSEETEFECYNSPHTEIEFEELKNIVLSKIFPNMYKNTTIPQPGNYGC
jgi:hypothetical protein